jgi:hypothetical protein
MSFIITDYLGAVGLAGASEPFFSGDTGGLGLALASSTFFYFAVSCSALSSVALAPA